MQGLWTAIITPFDSSEKLDLNAYRRLLKKQIEADVAGLVVCGSTGESATLTLDEKKTLIQTTLKELRGTSVQVCAGVGSNNTATTIEMAKWAEQEGVNSLLVVTPYYNRPAQSGLEKHFLKVADSVQCEIVAYNVPGRTGVCLEPETIVRLAHHPRIRTLKEATGNLTFLSEILCQLSHLGLQFDVLSGDDPTYLAALSVGAVGAMSVASNLIPNEMVKIQKFMEKNDFQSAMEIHRQYFPLFRDLFLEPNPVPIKFVLAELGLCEETVRLPLTPLSNSTKIKLKSHLQKLSLY